MRAILELLQYCHHDKCRIKQQEGIHDEIPLVSQAASQFQEACACNGAPQDRQSAQNVSQQLQINNGVHDKDFDQGQNVHRQQSVSHNAGDGPKTHRVRGTDEIDQERHDNEPKQTVDINVSELELSGQHHFATQEQHETNGSWQIAVLANGSWVDLIATKPGKRKDYGFGFEKHVLQVDT